MLQIQLKQFMSWYYGEYLWIDKYSIISGSKLNNLDVSGWSTHGFIGPQWSSHGSKPWPVQCSSSPRPGHFHTAPGSTMQQGHRIHMVHGRVLLEVSVCKCSHTITRLSVCACVVSSMKMSLPQGNCKCPKPKLLCRGSLSNLSRTDRCSQLQRVDDMHISWLSCGWENQFQSSNWFH